MFSTKKQQLFSSKKTGGNESVSTIPKNPFIRAGLKKSLTTTALGNGAVKLKSSGNDFVDQFGKITNYKAPRSFGDITKDMSLLWSQNPLTTLCFLFYVRMVTRVTSLFDGKKTETTQRGQGLKHEGIFRMIWVAVNYPETFKKNISLFISVGSWKDIFTMLSYDLQYNGWDDRKLDWEFMGNLILAGLENPKTSELVKKYLPQIKANSKCTTLESQADNIIAKWICSLLFGNKETASSYKKYRKLKSSGTAHEWQKLISQKKFLKINFNTVAGRALASMVSGKFLKNQGLEAGYQKWLETKPVAKYTGYVYELFSALGTGHNAITLKKYQEDTINKQFLGLIETAKKGMKEGDGGLIVVVDSSGSMTSQVPGTKVSAYSVAKSMALYFSYLLKGQFSDHFLEFSNDTIMKTWKGATPVDKYRNERSAIVAGTNFQSVGDHFGKILKSGVAESDFPTGILCVSDGCFNNSGSNKSETKALRARLKKYGFSDDYVKNFKVILWDVPNGYYGKSQTAFEDFADCPNLFHISGLDPAAVAFITGVEGQKSTPKSSEELFDAAMDQEILNILEV